MIWISEIPYLIVFTFCVLILFERSECFRCTLRKRPEVSGVSKEIRGPLAHLQSIEAKILKAI